VSHASLATLTQPERYWAPNQDCPGTKRERFEYVRTTAYSGIEKHFQTVTHGPNDVWKNIQGAHSAVYLAPTMVGYHNPVRSNIYCEQRIIWMLDSLEYHWPTPMPPQEFHILPCPINVIKYLGPSLYCRYEVDSRWRIKLREKDWIGEWYGRPNA
jgi:hypothetical protein